MKYLSGIESTYIYGTGKDVLDLTRHKELFREDLSLVRKCGVDQLRYSIPWHSVETVQGTYDWTWVDQALKRMLMLGIDPILDPLHHTSFPDWLTEGFADDRFVSAYLRFVLAISERYPWVKQYTVFNEPFVTTWFCGHEGTWYPFYKGADRFVPMLMNVVDAIISVSRMLVATVPGVNLIHVDAAEKHRAMDEASVAHAEFSNKIRFLVPDLVLGNVGSDHDLYQYLITNGARPERLDRFRAEPGRIDVIGLDYYSHCELEWSCNGRIYPNQKPQGLVPTAIEYAERFRLPMMLSETNIRGYVSDRISWLKFMSEQCEEIERKVGEIGLPFLGFCWYPFIDSTDWCSMVKEAKGCVDPQGIYWLDRQTLRRTPSELSDIYKALACGQMTSKDIPAYRFQEPLDTALAGFMPLMEHWDWVEPKQNWGHSTPNRRTKPASFQLACAA
jgi:beta-glucosidase/6-phospho-beta-glucosidase/beta-galactosidase